jgi:3',5'-cyclic AMP phosphodiesterase CpdA
MTIKKLYLPAAFLAAILTVFTACVQQQTPAAKASNEFSFVFMTDIHVQREKNAISGFRKAINKVNELNPAFVITGGDLVYDVLGQTYDRSDSLYYIYNKMLTEFKMPVFNTLGNHEIYGWYSLKGSDTLHPEYGKAMFEKRIGPRFQRVDRNGWVIFILDSVVKDSLGGYEGRIDAEQMAWLEEQLRHIPAEVPILISTHIPFLTTGAEVYEGPTAGNPPSIVVVNAKEVTELFEDHNLKMVLQGHLHFYESIHVFGTDYITAGAVCGAWWEGPYYNTEEGFLLVKVNDGKASWEYVDYGWEANFITSR